MRPARARSCIFRRASVIAEMGEERAVLDALRRLLHVSNGSQAVALGVLEFQGLKPASNQ